MLLDSFMEGIFKSGSDLRSLLLLAEKEVGSCADQKETNLRTPQDLSLSARESVPSNVLLDFGCDNGAYRDFRRMQVIDGGAAIVLMAWQVEPERSAQDFDVDFYRAKTLPCDSQSFD